MCPRISFRVKTTEIDNQCGLYPRTFSYVSCILEGVDFTVSYAPVAGIKYIIIFITIASTEGMIMFLLGISNSFQNTILPNLKEIFHIILSHIYLYWFKREWQKHQLASHNIK